MRKSKKISQDDFILLNVFFDFNKIAVVSFWSILTISKKLDVLIESPKNQ